MKKMLGILLLSVMVAATGCSDSGNEKNETTLITIAETSRQENEPTVNLTAEEEDEWKSEELKQAFLDYTGKTEDELTTEDYESILGVFGLGKEYKFYTEETLQELKKTIIPATYNVEDIQSGRGNLISLQDFEKFKNLKFLRINYNNIANTAMNTNADIDTTKWDRITCLELTDCNLNSLDWVVELPNLCQLSVGINQISDISALKYCPKLYVFAAKENLIRDISVLEMFPEMALLDLSQNQVSDISALNGLENLEYLILSQNQISDIDDIGLKPVLKDLRLAHNNISNIDALNGMTELRRLQLRNNQIEDISAISSMVNLSELAINHNCIKDITPVRSNVNLKLFGLSGNQVQSLEAIKDLSELQELYFNYNPIKDIQSLNNLNKLSVVELDRSVYEQNSDMEIWNIIENNNNGKIYLYNPE